MLTRCARINLLLVLAVFLLSACSSLEQTVEELEATDVPPTPTVEPLSDVFKSAISDFISVGSKLNAATGQGVSYLNYRDYYAEAGGAYDLAVASWPENFAPEARDEFDRAMWGWDLTGYLWNARINDGPAPKPSNDERYTEFIAYAGDELNGPSSNLILVTDSNISILLTMASEQFEAGRELVLPLLQ